MKKNRTLKKQGQDVLNETPNLKKEKVEQALRKHWSIDPDEIEVKITNTDVELTGYVGSLYQKQEAERITYQVSGVLKVINNLKIDMEQPYLC